MQQNKYNKEEKCMTFGIFLGLIGIPAGIILTAVICFYYQKGVDENDSVSLHDDQKGGVSQ
jgi:hypothetical protein